MNADDAHKMAIESQVNSIMTTVQKAAEAGHFKCIVTVQHSIVDVIKHLKEQGYTVQVRHHKQIPGSGDLAIYWDQGLPVQDAAPAATVAPAEKKKDTVPNWVVALIIFAGIAMIFIMSKPPDDVCQAQVMKHYTGSIIGSGTFAEAAGSYLYTVEDHIFFKQVRNTITGSTVAYAYLGGVHMQ